MIHPAYAQAVAADAKTYRDVKTQDGYTLRQFPNGQLQVMVDPEKDHLGYPVPGTRGGLLQGHTLSRKSPGYLGELWGKFTATVGPYPRKGYGAPPETRRTPGEWLTAAMTGFTGEPESGTGEFIAAGVQATPGIQSWIHQITNPGTAQSINRQLGRLRGKLKGETNPVRRAQIEQQIVGLEKQLAYVEGELYKSSNGTGAAPSVVPLWAIGLGGAALLGLLVFAQTRTR